MADRDKDSTASSTVHEQDGQTVQDGHDNAAVLVYTTFPAQEDAKRIGRALVEARLAACVNIFSQMTAIYIWEGKIEEDGETAMIVKTTDERSAEVLQEIKRMHPYSVPARLVLPVVGGGGDFLAWICDQCGQARKAE